PGLQKLVADLSSIEFDSASDVRRYIVTLRDACKVLAVELEFASDDLEQRLRAVPPLGDDESGVVIARRARQVAKHMRRSAEAARGVGARSGQRRVEDPLVAPDAFRCPHGNASPQGQTDQPAVLVLGRFSGGRDGRAPHPAPRPDHLRKRGRTMEREIIAWQPGEVKRSRSGPGLGTYVRPWATTLGLIPAGWAAHLAWGDAGLTTGLAAAGITAAGACVTWLSWRLCRART